MIVSVNPRGVKAKCLRTSQSHASWSCSWYGLLELPQYHICWRDLFHYTLLLSWFLSSSWWVPLHRNSPFQYISLEIYFPRMVFLESYVSSYWRGFFPLDWRNKILTIDRYLIALSKQPQKLWNTNIVSCWIAYSVRSVHQWHLQLATWMVCFSDSASLFVFVKQKSFYFLCPISTTGRNYRTMAFKYNHCPCATSLLYGSNGIKSGGTQSWSRWWQHHVVPISFKLPVLSH